MHNAAAMTNPYRCPKCDRQLPPSGEVCFDGVTFPVYSCDECLMTVEMFGTEQEIALTFVLDADGNPCDPASPDMQLRF